MLRARVDIVRVRYKGTSLAVNDLLAGLIQGMFDAPSTAAPLIKEGRLRAIAVTSAEHSHEMPNLPTIGEAGVKDYSADAWSGLVAPAGTPREVARRLQAAWPRLPHRTACSEDAEGGSLSLRRQTTPLVFNWASSLVAIAKPRIWQYA